MDMNEFYVQNTSAEQKRNFDLLVQLSDNVRDEIIKNRSKTIDRGYVWI